MSDDILIEARGIYTRWNNPPSPGLPENADIVLRLADEVERLREALVYIAHNGGPGDSPMQAIANTALTYRRNPRHE